MMVSLSDDEQIDLSGQNQVQKKLLVVEILDWGEELTSKEIKKKFEIASVKRIVKAMGGKLDAHSYEKVTTFRVMVPCHT